MSEGDGTEHHGEVIIVHRHGDHEEGHHGGAWKIAFADFMTAMMAFFLVMWLINSTDEQTLSQVANYFSPIKLTDRTVTERGIHDAEHGSGGNEEEKQDQRKKEGKQLTETKTEPGEKRFPEDELFAEPYDVLAKLAMMATKVPPRPGGGLRQEGRAGGEAFRDPFDPDFRANVEDGPVEDGDPRVHMGYAEENEGKGPARQNTRNNKSPEANEQPGPKMAVHLLQKGNLAKSRGEALGEENATPNAKAEPGKTDAKEPVKPKPDARVPEKPEAASTVESKPLPESKAVKQAPPQGTQEASQFAQISQDAQKIEREFREGVKESGLIGTPNISVTATPDGVLISLTDKMNFEMFAIASAEPRPELVVVMEKLGKVLEKQPGNIIIRGHTDSRAYRSKIYDNWRLSTSRAHMAYFMLARAGIPKKRVDRIEGYADRSLKNPQNPRAAENRRIEILLKPENP
jgi:chemotaxis protein MotB